MAETLPNAPMLVFDEFLVASELNGLLDFTLGNEANFSATKVLRDGAHRIDAGYRRSRVLYDLGWFLDLFTERILTFLPHVWQRLSYPEFPISHLEVQLTATNDGEFFRRHNDNGSKAVDGRMITFVYFFFREPQPFEGGQLLLYNTRSNDNADTVARHTIYPQQNQMVFFIADYVHEIVPVACPSQQFADSRFTVNGWLHK